MQTSMCDFGTFSSATPRVIAPALLLTSDLDVELSDGIKSSVLQGLTQTIAIALGQEVLVYLGYSEQNAHFLSKVH